MFWKTNTHFFPENFTFNPVERHNHEHVDKRDTPSNSPRLPCSRLLPQSTLRAPSYYGRLERSLHGYIRSPLPDSVHAGILCIGGLGEVTRILRHESLDDRGLAVDNRKSSVFQRPINYTPETPRWPLALGQKKNKRPSLAAVWTSLRVQLQHLPAAGLAQPTVFVRRSSETPKAKGSKKPIPTPYLEPSKERLSPEHARTLLQDLPALEQICIPTAEALLLARHAVERWQDIKRNGQVMHELILDEFTAADGLFYGCNERDFNPDKSRLGWRDLLHASHPMGH